mmetsp:Transcript_4823/g.6860  ORF Transcript_4823/g.6860 Transcript_4823/m.6860 type:complete len:548 (+) Transcript_4823:167-1810(+)|eukprot:CAMPEP_0184485058 /NCGR_PEP_ID=MMETSP0113_2-20130426/6703_1 /TAXON_ID=91329 /ORGANISM="Norrisiella sphaerica, Strain BC52" /LENGTH=547 /DNA_ID=CAMNT_0026866329 /DNA_START=254 /DNA_END=1897 /DNA_ORIENTATION=-
MKGALVRLAAVSARGPYPLAGYAAVRSIRSSSKRGHMGHGHGHRDGGHGHSHGTFAFEEMQEEAGKAAQRITWIGMGANAGLCIGKATVGFSSGSASLVADAAHSISDMVSDVVALVAVKIGRKPADEKQPYGYGHYETLGTLTVSTMLVGAGVGSAMHGIDHLVPLLTGHPATEVTMVPAAITCALVSVGVKEWLYQVTVKVGKETRSQVLMANAWHHRTDAFSSIVALLGIGGAALGFPFLDPIGAILVSGMIMKTGVEIGWEAVHHLVDAQVNERVLHTVKDIGKRLAEEGHIRNLHNVRCRRLGHYVLVDLHVMVDEFLTVTAAHQAAQRVEHKIKMDLPEVAEVMMHLDAEVHHDIDSDEEGSRKDPSKSQVDGKVTSRQTGQALDEFTENQLAARSAPHDNAQGKAVEKAQPTDGPKSGVDELRHVKNPLGRTHPEIESDIREVVRKVQGNHTAIKAVTHTSLHYRRPNERHKAPYVLAEVSLVFDSGITVAAAKMAALVIRDEIVKSVPDVEEVDVHMELLHGVLPEANYDNHYPHRIGE